MAFDFGEDVSCIEDLEEEMRIVTGKELLAQALIRRWSTPRGALIDDDDYGTDLSELINEAFDALAMARFRTEVRQEALKDERVQECLIVSSAFEELTKRLKFEISITAVDGDIRLTVEVNEVNVTLLSVE